MYLASAVTALMATFSERVGVLERVVWRRVRAVVGWERAM